MGCNVPSIDNDGGTFGYQHSTVNIILHHTVRESYKKTTHYFKGKEELPRRESPPEGVVGFHLLKWVGRSFKDNVISQTSLTLATHIWRTEGLHGRRNLGAAFVQEYYLFPLVPSSERVGAPLGRTSSSLLWTMSMVVVDHIQNMKIWTWKRAYRFCASWRKRLLVIYH